MIVQLVTFTRIPTGGIRLRMPDGQVIDVPGRTHQDDALAQYLGMVPPGKPWTKGMPKGYRMALDQALDTAPPTTTLPSERAKDADKPKREAPPRATPTAVPPGYTNVAQIEGYLGNNNVRVRKLAHTAPINNWETRPAPLFSKSVASAMWVDIDEAEFRRLAGAIMASI